MGDDASPGERLRAAFLATHPFCQCGRLASEVDHRKPLNKGGTNAPENLVARCKRCHSRKTATEDMRRGEGGRWG